MKQSAAVIRGFLKKEFAQVLRDPVMRIFLLVAPVLQLMVFGYAISNEFTNLSLAVAAQPGDTMARQLAGSLYASSKWFVPARGEEQDPLACLSSGKAHAVLVMPPEGLGKALARGRADIQLLIDASNTTRARSIENYATAIVNRFAAGAASGPAPRQPVEFSVRILFNPTMETAYFLVPGVMTMIILLVTVMLTAMSLAREKELGTIETIIAAPLHNYEIILGKTIPYIIFGMINAFVVIAAGMLLFGVPLRGPVSILALSTFIFVCATTGIGTLISTIARNQQQAMMGAFLFIFPANMMSGIMFPIENIPAVLKVFAYADPLTYFVRILRNIMLKGAHPELVWPNIAILSCMAVLIITAAVRRFHQKLN